MTCDIDHAPACNLRRLRARLRRQLRQASRREPDERALDRAVVEALSTRPHLAAAVIGEAFARRMKRGHSCLTWKPVPL